VISVNSNSRRTTIRIDADQTVPFRTNVPADPTSKGLRHALGISMVSGSKPLPIHILAKIMGHTNTKITEIYLKFTGEEKRKLILNAWED